MDKGLICAEDNVHGTILASDSSPVSTIDENITKDSRVLRILLKTESKYLPGSAVDCYSSIQTEIKPEMRKILTVWMMDVCEELKCEEATFPLAVNYLDRCLCKINVMKSQLQLLGSVCLLIASKVRQCNSIAPETLVHYTDYSTTVEEMLAWELFVLSQLNWDVSSVIATDFVEHLLSRLLFDQKLASDDDDENEERKKNKERLNLVRRHTLTLISLCSTELDFSICLPSLLATSSLAAAIHGLKWTQILWSSLDEMLSLFQEITGITTKTIKETIEKIEKILIENGRNKSAKDANEKESSQSQRLKTVTYVLPKFLPPVVMSPVMIAKSVLIEDTSNQPETPTDVLDIEF